MIPFYPIKCDEIRLIHFNFLLFYRMEKNDAETAENNCTYA